MSSWRNFSRFPVQLSAGPTSSSAWWFQCRHGGGGASCESTSSMSSYAVKGPHEAQQSRGTVYIHVRNYCLLISMLLI